ncbi:16S rRNA (cytosine(1402)-N(4))-methyltransferase RsmH [soil metagenome]
MTAEHQPVLLEKAVRNLRIDPDSILVDATFGGGGHARRILGELGEGGRLIAIDRDPDAAERASLLSDERFQFSQGPFDEALWSLVEAEKRVDAVLFDLGLSSYQIDERERGFSYVGEGPLDMRMDPTSGISAADYLNTVDPGELAQVLTSYGDVPRGQARRITQEISRSRPLKTTSDLLDIVRAAVGWVERGGNPAKRVFQAVRVQINDELGSLTRALDATERLLVAGGRLVAITFHSGEDRIVKRFIADRTGRCVCPPDLPVCACGAEPVFRKGPVIEPTDGERRENPRSASARLRVAYRTDRPGSDVDGDS